MKSTLYIVACSATKARTLEAAPMPAGDAYIGQAFRLARQQLQRAREKWCILSGHYGFIWPSTIIENYNVKMQPVTKETVWHECFGSITDRQYARLMTAERVVVLGSRLYADAAAVLLDRPVEAPLAGLSIGRMLSALSQGSFLHQPSVQ
jgi:cytoplasmic iron level regulating protein YaaA (DUF328/UPF0246 family)